MSHLPAIPEVILLDFLPEPGELQEIIRQRLPGLATPAGAAPGGMDPKGRSAPKAWVEGFILLDFLPTLVALDGVIKAHRPPAAAHRGGF